jgi:hypothetical protein
MKIFLSALESAHGYKCEGSFNVAERLVEQGVQMKWNLISYYYSRGKAEQRAKFIRDNSLLTLVDSGAHTFQFGVKVDWLAYTKQYADFIKRFDNDKVLGYFEMDIENVIGYEAVLELRKVLENVSDKIIPVWHPLRGIEEYEKMCSDYTGKIITIGGFKGTDIKDEQFLSFLKVARKYGCKVHCLGMTRIKVLDTVPFDFTDSSSWKSYARFGKIGSSKFQRGTKVSREYSKRNYGTLVVENYKQGMLMQEHYYKRWRKECND